RAAPPVVARARRPRGDAIARRLDGSPRRFRTRTLSVARLTDLTSSISERGARWGILPAYYGWLGDVVETTPAVEAAILDAIGAQTPRLRYESSPYYASTRRFRNMIFLRVDEVEGADAVDLRPALRAARRLNSQRIIDYDAVFRIKTSALEEIFRAAPQPRG